MGNLEIEIIVADDDPMLSARKDISNIAKTSTIPVQYLESAAQNIAICRNVCLESAKGDWIAFIDDDQIAEPDWLREMISTASEFNADAVKCTVRGIYPPNTLPWILAGDPYGVDCGKTGTQVRFAATCGILFRRDIPGSRDLWFDPSLGITGGEDFEFFLRYMELGGKVVSCQKAVAGELVSSERAKPRNLSRRFRRHGHINGRVLFSQEPLLRRLVFVLKSFLGIAVTCPYSAVRAFNGTLACWMFMKFWYHFGVLEWALGREAFAHD